MGTDSSLYSHLDGVSGERIGLFFAMQLKFSKPHSLPIHSIDKALEYFLDVIIKASENAIPHVMPFSKPRVPWWNPECREAIRERKKALRRFHRTKYPEDFIKYKLFKTKSRRVLRITRRAYTKNFLSSLNSSLSTNVKYKYKSFCS